MSVWGGLFAGGKTPPVVVREYGAINGRHYRKDELKGCLSPWNKPSAEVQSGFSSEAALLSAPQIHQSTAQSLFSLLWSHDISLSSTPDLNLLDYIIQRILKCKVKGTHYYTTDTLNSALRKPWGKIPVDLVMCMEPILKKFCCFILYQLMKFLNLTCKRSLEFCS